ncbi:arylsulfatase [Tautonia marina]|uniref:arylsulfatase n=1 Tax=Tautonia marina TaxID=2653855 RepID=UPI0012609E08|nr:arylsulfatase [Tautonia marina]
MRDHLRCSALPMITALVALTAGPGAADDSPRRPNVLMILTDDQGWGDVRCHGNPAIDTPTLDALAGQGVRFDRFFVSPVCAPTRASLLTGRDHLRTGTVWVTHRLESMRSEEITLAEALRAAGYATGCFGKWHNGAHYPMHPNGQGFDEFLGFCGGHLNNYFNPLLERNGRPIQPEGYISDILTDAAIDFLRQHHDQPFFCYIPYNVPHSPDQVPDAFFQKYANQGLDPKLASVYAMTEQVDANIARLLATLDALELADETIVVFLSDNGPNTDRYNGGMRGRKGSIHEGGTRVPMFLRWPGTLTPGTTVSQIAAHIDVMPTILDLCGVEPPEGVDFDGVSLIPLLDGFEPDWPDRMLFTNQCRPIPEDGSPLPGSVRTQRFRYVRERDSEQLYDLVADPGQQHNIAAEHPEQTRTLANAYDSWFAEVTQDWNGVFPVPVGHPDRPRTTLLGPDATFEGGIRWWATHGYANDWLTDWTRTDQSIRFDLDVLQPGKYQVTLHYTAPSANLGARIVAEANGQSVEGVLASEHDPDPIPSPDRVPRGSLNEQGHWRGEAYEKVWNDLPMGLLPLKAGRQLLSLRAVEVPGGGVMDLKGVELEFVEP